MTRPLRRTAFLFLAAGPAALFGADQTASSPGWHAQSLGQAVAYVALFAAIGIILAILGYKVFDRCTPGHLHREVIEHRNVAAAIIGGSVILGVCIIIAAAMLG
jgi:putative membrane protein